MSDGERRLRGLERAQFPRNIFVNGYNGFRPIIGGMPSGSGLVVGGGYRAGGTTAPVSQRFGAAAVPGFGIETDYYRYGTHVEVDVRDDELPAAGVWARVDAQRFENRSGDPFSFDRVVGDVHGYVPLGYRNRMLALRFRTSHSMTQSGQQVPFYLMETLGGAGTLRGFSEYRFRDTRNLLFNAELPVGSLDTRRLCPLLRCRQGLRRRL